MLEIIMVGTAIVVIPAISFAGNYRKILCKIWFILTFIAFTSLGLYLILAMTPEIYKYTPYSTSAFYFAIISLIVIAISFNPDWNKSNKDTIIAPIDKFENFSTTFWLVSHIIIYTILGVILIFALIFLQNAGLIFTIFMYFIAIITLIIIVKKNKFENQKLIIYSSFILITVFFIFSYISAYFSPFSGLYLAEVNFGDATNVLSDIIYTIVGNSLFMLVLVLILIGGLVKVISANRAATMIANILVLWLPSFIWILVIFNVVPVPNEIIALFGGNYFFAWLMYILIYGALMTIASGAVQTFQGLKILGGG